MAAKKSKLKIIFFIATLVLSAPISAESEITNSEVVNYLHKNIAISTVKLGHEIELCEKKKLNSGPALLNAGQLKALSARNNDVIIALTHLSYRNSFECEKTARVNLAYDLNLLASITRQHKSNIKDITKIEDNLIYPSIKELRLSIKYSKLPAKLKKHIKEVVKNKPFDLIKTLSANHLMDFK